MTLSVNPRISPWVLTYFLGFLHGELFEGGLICLFEGGL